MTYAERIEAMAMAIGEVLADPSKHLKPDLLLSGKINAHVSCREIARAADAACLKALEEPTEEMQQAGACVVETKSYARSVWAAMWSAINRGL